MKSKVYGTIPSKSKTAAGSTVPHPPGPQSFLVDLAHRGAAVLPTHTPTSTSEWELGLARKPSAPLLVAETLHLPLSSPPHPPLLPIPISNNPRYSQYRRTISISHVRARVSEEGCDVIYLYQGTIEWRHGDTIQKNRTFESPGHRSISQDSRGWFGELGQRLPTLGLGNSTIVSRSSTL